MIRLLALDIDGTLLRRDGTLDPRDREAIARARGAGLAVTLCTGRIWSGTAALAAALGIELEVVCADGSSVVCARRAVEIESHTLDAHELEDLLGQCAAVPGLAPFLLSNHEVRHDLRGAPYLPYVRGWSPELKALPEVAPGPDVLMGVALGDRDLVEVAAEFMQSRHGERLQVIKFPSRRGTGTWALLLRRAGQTKGSAMIALGARLGHAPDELAAVGDWWNDLSLFRAVGRSFAMGQAPADVAAAADQRLAATDEAGGGVAEAIARILEERKGCGL